MRVSIVRKRRLAAALVLFLALWPAVHHGLARSYGINPWRFLGWSMYAVPNARVNLALRGYVEGRELQISVGEEARAAGDRYARWRVNLGDFASARPLAEAALAEHPALDAVDVIVYTRVLDRESARFERVESRLHFSRE